MPLSPKPYRDWDESDVAQLIEDPQAEESARLDFKKECSLLSTEQKARDKAEKDMLKDIASMANAGGGAILLGVNQERREDAPPVARELPGISADEVEKLRQRISDLVNNHLDVRPPSPIITPVNVPGQPDKRVLIVQVQQNTYSLSMVKKDGLNQFWNRRGWDNTPMSTDEIQHAFDQMTRLRQPAEEELYQIRSRVTMGARSPSAWVAVVPLRRSRDHVPTDPNAIKEALVKDSEWNRFFPKTDTPACYTFNEYRPFLRGMRTSIDDYGILIELHRDGTVLFRMPVWRWDQAPGHSLDDPRKFICLDRLYQTWSGGLCVFRDLTSHFGFPPIALAGAGCLGFSGRRLAERVGLPSMVKLSDDSVAFDPILLPETWDARSILAIWAGEMANWLGEAKAFSCPPYVK